ncbi:MAG TPA: type II toxin-antitoxin system HicB family antitoxin [Chloroflexota bacterium]|nr:type II toxin-antitoxin system HicB family antitoxin [Chloroflexota bacterium]
MEQPGPQDTLEYGLIDGYRIVYEHGPTSWGAYSDDLPGCIAVARSRAAVERRMRAAIAVHLESMARDHAPAASR